MKKADIIVLSGQSNAVGVGHVSCLPSHFDNETIAKWKAGYPDIKINYFSHDKKSGGFVNTSTGCTEVKKETIGPELGIAAELAEKYPGREFFIVKFAVGGMSMHKDFLSPSGGAEYDAGSYADQLPGIVACIESGAVARPSWCYNELVKLLRESISYLEDNGYEPSVRAFCWMQGENDACSEQFTETYIKTYGAMLHDLSAAFPGYFDECVYIDAGISAVWPFYERINADKRAFAEQAENRVYIDTIAAGLTTEHEPFGAPDTYHYDSDCVIKLGRLFARAMKL